MSYTFTIFLIGFAAIVLSAVGLATTITVSGVNPLGVGNTTHAPALSYIEKVEWKKNGDDEFTQVKITVYNPDTVEHEYEVCMLFYNGTGISDAAGTSPDCLIDTINDDDVTRFQINPSNLITETTSTNIVMVQNW